MERNIQRIDGIKMDLSKMTDQELEQAMQYTHDRLEAHAHDMELLGIESARRFAETEVDYSEIVTHIDHYRPGPEQGILFDDNTAS